MRKLLLALTLALLPGSAWAQGVVGPRSLQAASTSCALATDCLPLGVEGYGSAAVQLIVTGTATAVVEGSINGQLFTALTMSQVGGSGNVTSATATGSWSVNVAGMTQVRVRLSVCTSCTVVAMLQATRSGGGAAGGGGSGGDASAANQSTEITSLQLLDDVVFAEDVAASAADKGVSVLAVRRDADTSLVGTDNDYAQLQVNATGQLKVACITGCSGGTAYTQDAALTVATSTGTMAMGRASAAAPTGVSADDDAVLPWYLRSGAQAVQPTFGGVLAVAGNGASGTGVQRVTLANDSTGVVGLSAGSAVIGHVIVDSGGGGGTQFAEDVASANGDVGTLAMARRTASPANTSGTDGDYETLQMSAGRLWVDPSGVTLTVAAHAVTNAGTFATQVDGAALTSLQLIDDVVFAEDVAASAADKGVSVLAVRRDADTSLVGTDNDYAQLQVNAGGQLKVACITGCSGAGGTSAVDDADFVDGSSSFTLAGAVAESASPSTVTEGDMGALAMTINRGLKVVLYDVNGDPLTPSQDQTEDAAASGGETGPMVLTVRRDTAASSAGTDGDFATLNTDASGRLWVNCGTGCSGGTQYTQDAALTVATSVVTMAGGRASAAVPTDVSADNDAVMPWYLRSGAAAIQQTFAGALATTGAGNVGTGVQRVVLATDQAAMVGLAIYAEDAAETAGGNLAMAGTVRRDTAAASAGASGDNATLNTDALGKLWISGAYAEDAAHSSGDLGLAILTKRTDTAAASSGTDGDYQTLNTDASGRLWVNCGTGCSGGTQYTEDAASAGGETLTLAGAIRQNTLASSVSADGDYANLKVDTNGSLYVNPFGATQAANTYISVRLTDGTGFLTAAADQTEDAASAGGEAGPMVLSVRRDTAASSAGTAGDFATFNTDATGKLWVSGAFAEDAAHSSGDIGIFAMGRRIDAPAASSGTSGDYEAFNMNASGALWVSMTDPCSSESKITDPFSLTARGVIIAATSSKKNYICGITVVAGAAEIFNIDEGTGTTCQTGTAAIVGSTTAANGLSFAANGGFSAIGSNSTVLAGKTANVDTCIVPSSTNRLSGFVTYVQR